MEHCDVPVPPPPPVRHLPLQRCHSERMTALHATYLSHVPLISVQGMDLLEYLSGYCLFKDSTFSRLILSLDSQQFNYLICISGK
jgi:hypothetical protein